MGFFDLNIPFYESDRQIADKSGRKATRLKLIIKVMELGYTGVAYNRTIKGVMSESDRCSIPLFPLSSILNLAPSLFAAVKFHRDLLGVPSTSPFRQYTRLTVVVDSSSQASTFNSGNPILQSYDFVAIRPVNQNAFDQACQGSQVDLISIDFSEKLPFRLKQPVVKAAIERGVYFEITYSSLIMDVQVRRQMISNVKLLVDWTRGKNLVLSSAAPSVAELRGPYDVANLSSLVGLSAECAKAAVSKNCRSLIANALRKRNFYKETIRVEAISSGGRFDLKEPVFDDWFKWDPISSGEGDLKLDDMAKSFSATNKASKTAKAIDFALALDSLPSNGFRVKDLLPVADLEPLDTSRNLSSTEKDELPSMVYGESEQPGMLNLLEDVTNATCNIEESPSDQIELPTTISGGSELSDPLNLLYNEYRTSITGTLANHQLCGEDCKTSVSPTNTLQDFNDAEKIGSPAATVELDSKIEVHDLRSQSCDDTFEAHSFSPDNATAHASANGNEIAPEINAVGTSQNFSLSKCVNLSASQLGEFNQEITPDLILSGESMLVDKISFETDIISKENVSLDPCCASSKENVSLDLQCLSSNEDLSLDPHVVSSKENVSLDPHRASLSGVLLEKEQFMETNGIAVMVSDGFPMLDILAKNESDDGSSLANVKPLKDLTMEDAEQTNDQEAEPLKDRSGKSHSFMDELLSGKRRVRRKPRAILFPFKPLLNPRPFKKRDRKSGYKL